VTKDKQLANIKLAEVLERRRLEQALNVKEFAVLVGISYSAARQWFRTPGFPVFRSVVFWQDFVRWKSSRNTAKQVGEKSPGNEASAHAAVRQNVGQSLSPRAAQLLAECEFGKR
jgi:hypothetical protein